LGYIGIVQHKEHSPEVLSIPPRTPCINGREHGITGKKEACLNCLRIAAKKCSLHSRGYYYMLVIKKHNGIPHSRMICCAFLSLSCVLHVSLSHYSPAGPYVCKLQLEN